MDGIFEKLNDFIKEILQEWVASNLAGMFADVDAQVGSIAGEVSKLPPHGMAAFFR